MLTEIVVVLKTLTVAKTSVARFRVTTVVCPLTPAMNPVPLTMTVTEPVVAAFTGTDDGNRLVMVATGGATWMLNGTAMVVDVLYVMVTTLARVSPACASRKASGAKVIEIGVPQEYATPLGWLKLSQFATDPVVVVVLTAAMPKESG